jgi:hypothetical protein
LIKGTSKSRRHQIPLDLLNETPEKVVIPKDETAKIDGQEISTTLEKEQTMETETITFKEPVEDQGWFQTGVKKREINSPCSKCSQQLFALWQMLQ